jgi:PilZ domain
VKNRRSLTPSDAPDDAAEVHATRRGGARHEVSARVTLRPTGRSLPLAAGSTGPSSSAELEGWALNVSRGGIRVILEENVELGAEFEVTMSGVAPGEDDGGPRIGRIVWVQEEPDGVVAGIEFRAS